MSKETAFTADLIADYFLSLSNEVQDPITNLKLQKLVYYTQAWFYAYCKNPMFKEDFQAWVHGPVIPTLYDKYKGFSWHPIIRDDLGEGSLAKIKTTFGVAAAKVLDDVVNQYFPLSGFELEQLTHNEDPWKIARGSMTPFEKSSNEITSELIIAYYTSRPNYSALEECDEN